MTKSSAWGGKDFPIIASHGQHASWETGGLYDYTKGYGMDGDSHPGVDVQMPVGTTLYALADGVVDYIRQESYGTREVVIRPANGHRHLYTHTSQQLVKAGDRVTKGQAIARSGDPTGLPHLHFEHRVPDSSTKEKWRIIDPVPLLTAQEVTMDTRLTSKAIRTPDAVYQHLVSRGAQDPNGRSGFLKAYVNEVYRLAPKVNLSPDWIIAQACLETGHQQNGHPPFVSAVYKSRGNVAGIGVTDNFDHDYGFPNGETAARAQVAHMYLYVHGNTNLDPDISEYVDLDPRWDAVLAKGWQGTVKTVDDLAGKWATDPQYGAKLRSRFQTYIEGAEDTSDLVGDIIDIIDDIVNEQYAPPVFLKYLEGADPGQFLVRADNQAFFRVNAKAKAVRPTPRYQKAVLNGLKRGPDMEEDEEAYIEYAWIARDGRLWLYSEHGTRFVGADFVRVDGKPIVPQPEPEPEPDPKPEPKPQPKPGEITAENYRGVEDPTILLPPIEWVGSPNFFPNRQGFGKPIAIVDHITDDMNYANTKSWFQNPNSQASSHFVILRDGSVKQFVSSTDAAWTNGDVKSPRRDIPWMNDLINRRVNLNNATITIEHIGTPSQPPTEAQYQSSIALHRYFCHPKVYGINPDRSHNLRHGDINSVSRFYCPGPDFDKERIIRECGGDPSKLS